MKVLVTGASGLIGSALVPHLRARGHDVVTLVRRPPRTVDEIAWQPGSPLDPGSLAGVQGAVHLAGAGVGDHRWTGEYKDTIRRSRVEGTRTLVDALTALEPAPQTLVSGSAIGVYSDRGEQELPETAPPGTGFLAEVVLAWEAEAQRAAAAGIRVVTARTGLVMARHGGAFGRLLTLARFGLAGPMGSGRQWWSWITLDDEIGALTFLLESDAEDGPVNLTAPDPRRQADLVRVLAGRLHRPSLLPTPAFALRAVLGEFAQELTASQRVVPQRLLDAGFAFGQRDLDSAADWLIR
jgi:uncharacterized protein (TIGR01777 family)